MSEYAEVMKQYGRLCKHFSGEIVNCKECVLSKNNNGAGLTCSIFLYADPEKAEQAIMKWAEENPPQTNLDKLIEIFGDKFVDVSGCAMLKCNEIGKGCSECSHRTFWQDEYKGVITND